jgi:CDP-diacylglycerol pyrophosphatase
MESSRFGSCLAALPLALGLGVALVTGPAGAGWASPVAPVPCGDPADNDLLWGYVKDAKPPPANPAPNVKVVWPSNDQAKGYAIHNGAKGGSKYNYLLVPTVREKGIECPDLLTNSHEYFKLANDELAMLPAGTDWALGIESANNRTFNQLHIHVSRLSDQARTDINTAVTNKKVAADQGQWLNSPITVNGRIYRAWNAATMTHSFFGNLNDNIVKPLKGKVGMGDETMLITQNKGKGGGFIVLSSDKTSGLPKPYGVDNIESLLNKG